MAVQRNLIRKQFLVTEDNIQKLDKLARKNHQSAAEIVRLAIDNYDPLGHSDIEAPELMELVQSRLKEAIIATEGGNRKVARALQQLNEGKR